MYIAGLKRKQYTAAEPGTSKYQKQKYLVVRLLCSLVGFASSTPGVPLSLARLVGLLDPLPLLALRD